ncbi:MAG: ribosome recycling factor [Erysipelotrichaceae bacterium]|nr:ribosome recycling factor [Erysipelotrichaceae bacterium]
MQTILNQVNDKMTKAIASFEHELTTVRTGRANASLLDSVEVDYYGCPTPINQVGSISVVEGKQLVIKPFDKSILKDIETAIHKANIGIAPQNDGTVIRLNVPSLTEERRKELTKVVSKMAEEAKVAVRNVRRDGNDAVKKNKELTEDMQKDAQEKIQKKTDEFIKKIDSIAEAKQKEIMTV